MTQLQLAMDTLSLEEALELLKKVVPYIDIVEVGTPLLYRSGLEAVRRIRAAFPDIIVLCDSKIMDAGAYESGEQFEAGADCVSVLGVTDDATIRACVEEAAKYGGEVSMDTICISDLPKRVAEAEAMGVQLISVHTGVDQQAKGRTPLDDLKEIKNCAKRARISVAGGITAQTVETYLALEPDVIIVGGGILGQPDPVLAAREIHEKIVRYNK
jgi:3-hexulose-6-phosphate synthase